MNKLTAEQCDEILKLRKYDILDIGDYLINGSVVHPRYVILVDVIRDCAYHTERVKLTDLVNVPNEYK